MTLENVLNYSNAPEFVLDNMWFIEIHDDLLNNKVLFDDVDGKLDVYVSEVTIPQEALKFEKTSFGIPVFQEQEEYENITLTFYDDIECTMSNFIQEWLDSIYNRYKRQIQSDWRKQSKNINVYLFKTITQSSSYNALTNKINNVQSRIMKFENKINTKGIDLKICARYELENCFPVSIEPLSLSSDGSGERLAFTVTLECERMNPTYNVSFEEIIKQ